MLTLGTYAILLNSRITLHSWCRPECDICGGKHGGRVWEGQEFSQSSGGLCFPSPQTHPSPSHTLFCPINWHTPLATPSKASQMGRAKCTFCTGVWREHPVWAKFTCPFPTPVTCALREKSTTFLNYQHRRRTEPNDTTLKHYIQIV